MGSDNRLAKPNEQPAHKVRVHGFWMDRTPVTNGQFTAFVAATGYITTAERPPNWETLQAQLPAGVHPQLLHFFERSSYDKALAWLEEEGLQTGSR